MRRMIKRWLRRRLDVRMSRLEPSLDDNDRERGTLVRKGTRVALRSHVPANRDAFQRWYADPEIAELLRHDLEPLTPSQSRAYFDSFILPSSARGTCFAIHERRTKRLIGTTALTDRVSKPDGVSALFRIVIGEKDVWGQGYGTEATRLMAYEAFESMGLSEIRLEVFSHNARAISAYTRVGFEVTGEHIEWVPRRKRELRVIEMRLSRGAYLASRAGKNVGPAPKEPSERSRDERKRRRDERERTRARRRTQRTSPPEPTGTDTDMHQNDPRSANREAEPHLD
jgi:RimJ/RimL family protein N-acetyltransferase